MITHVTHRPLVSATAPTWSSLEYGGRWKLLHHYVRHFFAPVLVSAYEQPTDSLRVHITSDVNQALSGALYTRLWSWTGVGALAEWKTAFSLAPLASKPVLSYGTTSLP
jgi:beta-mannosidase